MSGIAALYERGGAPAREARIIAMLERLAHRGPDRRGHRVDGSIALAQAMLETTPEDALERQPLRAASGDVWLIADARLDNRAALLRLRGADAAETPDSTLILWAYERWGEDCAAKLLGDFAFVIWDGPRRRLFCARDQLGIRQLYYHHDAVAFRCATEMQALFADTRVPKRPDPQQIALHIGARYTEREATLYEGIRALPGGHTLTVDAAGALRVRRYWQPDISRSIRYASDAEHAAHFGEIFGEAVRCRLRANGPIAAEVSGGLDSSSVACEAERLRRIDGGGAPLHLMRVAFPGVECDESPYSQAVADHLGLPIFTLRPLDHPELGRPVPTGLDQYWDPTVSMFVPLQREARRRGIRTTLAGLGGDALMRWTGYEGFLHLLRGRFADAVAEIATDDAGFSPAVLRGVVAKGLATIVPARVMNAVRSRRLPPRRRWPWLTAPLADVVMEDFLRAQQRIDAHRGDPIDRTLAVDLTHSLDIVLVQAVSDRLAASFGGEYRHPFMDVRVLEHLLAIPHEQRYFRGLPKPVLRRAMAGTLPELVRQRRDKGEFTSYLQRGFWERHADEVRALFRHSFLADRGIVDGARVRQDLETGDVDVGRLAFLTAMELWLRQATEPATASASSPTASSEEQHGYA